MPDALSEAHRRRTERKPVALKVRLAFGDVREFSDRYAMNISEGGIFIRSRDPRPVGTRLSFELRLRNDAVAFAGQGIVRWVQTQAAGSQVPGMGLQFEALTDESRAVLRGILDGRLPEHGPVDGANPEKWLPLDAFPPPPDETPDEAEEPQAPPMLAPTVPAGDRSPLTPAVLAPALRAVPEPFVRTAPLYPALPRQPVTTFSPAPVVEKVTVGIDLAWSSLRIAASGHALTVPAAVAFEGEALLFGDEASAALARGAPGARGLGGLPGLRPGSAGAKAWERRHLLPVVADDDAAALTLGSRTTPVSALLEGLLRSAIEKFEAQSGVSVKNAVLVLPAGVGLVQRRALRAVAQAIGLELQRIVPAPLVGACALVPEGSRRALVLTVDDGQLEAAVVEHTGHRHELVTAQLTRSIGGAELDLAIVELLLTQFEAETGYAVPEDFGLFERVRAAAAEAREALAEKLEFEIVIPSLVETGLSRAELRHRLTRARLQGLATPLVERALELVRAVLATNNLGPRDFDAVLALGQHARLPLLLLRLQERFGREPVRPANARTMMALEASRVALDGLTGSVATPLWIAPEEGAPKRLLERGLALPVERSYVAAGDEKARTLTLGLFEGDEPAATDDTRVGSLVVGPIPPPPPGERTRVTVFVALDAEGEPSFRARAMNGAEVPVVFGGRPSGAAG